MRSPCSAAFAALVAVMIPAPSPARPATSRPVASSPAIGLWSNPKHSLEVQTAPCGANLCGAIIRATDQARADAHEAGVAQLIGLQLLQDYRPIDGRTWRGRVYVPDMGHQFSSKIEQLSPDTLKISGCLIGTFFCKSQLWHRVK